MTLSMLLLGTTIVAAAGCGGCAQKTAQTSPPPAKPPAEGAKPAQPGADITLPPPSIEQLSPAEQKLDAALLELVRQKGEMKEAALTAWGTRHKSSTDKGRVSVDITSRTPAEADRVEAAVKKAGGEIVAKFENIVYARVLPDAVLTLANMSDVWTIAASHKVAGK